MTKSYTDSPKLPPSWIWTTIGNIAETTSGGTPSRKNPNYYEGTIPWVKSGELNDSRITTVEENITQEAIQNSNAKIFPKDTVLVALYGATVGKTAILGIDAATNQAICAIFPKANAFAPQFMNYWLRFKRPSLIELSTGGAQPNISQSIVRSFLFPLAPLPEQRRIVARIEEFFSRLDAGIEALQRAKTQLQRYRQATLNAAVEGRLTEEWRRAHQEVEPAEKLLARISKERRCFWENSELAKMSVKGERQKKNKYKEPEVPNLIDLPELPESWAWATVDQLSAYERNSITDGPFGSNLKTSHYTSDGPRVIRLQNIGKGEFKDEKVHISEDHFKKLKKHAVFPGDIVIAALGNPAPRACLIPEWIGDAIVKADCIRLKVVEEKISPLYVMYSLNSFPTQKRTEEVIHGVGRPRLNLGEIKNIVVPLPPIEEQEIISEEIERSLSIADKVNDTIEFNMKRSEFLRQSILKCAFEGKLVPPDPSDEPASVLLKKILEEDPRKKIELKPFKRVDIKKITMPKERLSLYEVLSDAGTQLAPEELFKKANFDEETVDEFYQELREDVNKLRIIENRPNEVEVYLKVVKNENK
jgi:type I restriction enzyme S subunit